MFTIDSENNNPIRQAMTVFCGIELHPELDASASGVTYDSVNGSVASLAPEFTQYMDLSNGGFWNDGNAVPLPPSHNGLIARYDSSTKTSTLTVTVNFDATTEASTQIGFIYYEGQNFMKSYEYVPAGTTTLTKTIESTIGRIELVKVTVGGSWWFNNDNIVSCSLELRGVETTVDNPELQISEIEIVAYEPNNMMEEIAMVGDNAPIYYSAGYPGDMSPMRQFYLSEQIAWEDKQLTIHGEDATRFLENEFAGKFVGNTSNRGGGINQYVTELHNMLSAAGVDHEYSNTYTSAPYLNGEPFLLPNATKRSLIGQAVNLIRYDSETYGNCKINYVDAGRPRLWTGDISAEPVAVIEDYSELKIEAQRKIKEIQINVPFVDVGASAEVETVDASGTMLNSLSDPYYSVSTSRGTISLITPYTYKLKASGSAVVSGRPIRSYDPTAGDIYSPYKVQSNGVETITLEDFSGMENGLLTSGGTLISFWEMALQQLINRSTQTYTFTWRGDPRIQPRDIVALVIEGDEVLVTIESITLQHEDGGLKSSIIARGGVL